jgi:hypothetical protein
VSAKSYLDGQFAADNEVSAIFLNTTQIYTGPTDGTTSQFSNFNTFFRRWKLAKGDKHCDF